MGHDCFRKSEENHESWGVARRLAIIFGIVVVFSALEALVGNLIGSVSLTSDAIHMLSDSIAVGINLITICLVLMGQGYSPQRTRARAFVLSMMILTVSMFFVAQEAWGKFLEPQEISSVPVLIATATLGLLVNLVMLRIHHKTPHAHQDGLHHSLKIHMLSDLLVSIGVVLGGCALLLTGWTRIDSAVTLFVALPITLLGAIRLNIEDWNNGTKSWTID